VVKTRSDNGDHGVVGRQASHLRRTWRSG
jgi:hypothetical protein